MVGNCSLRGVGGDRVPLTSLQYRFPELRQVEKNKERLKLEQGDDKVKDSQIARLIDMERVVSVVGVLADRLRVKSSKLLLVGHPTN